MTKPLPWSGRVSLLLLFPVALLPIFFGPQRSAVVVRQAQVRSGGFRDWSTHHVFYPHSATMATLEAARRDPRALFHWREMEQRQAQQRQASWLALRPSTLEDFLQFRLRRRPRRVPVHSASDMHADWSINLGGGATAAGQFPAKYTFDTTATPSCTNDFLVFPVNVAGSGTQPNLVGFNNLYSGTAGGTGICDGRSTPAGHSDTKTSPTVYWSYNIHALTNGAVGTSPVLSLDGTKVAFVESATGSPAHFHVLAWNGGDGQNANLQSLSSTKAITTFSGSAPTAGSGAATDLAMGSATTGTDTLSSPYIDYFNDAAYVGNDAGVLFKIKNVFCPAGGCSSPSLDTTWNGTGSVNVCSGKLTGPVQDFGTMNVYVGCSDGKVYGFNSTGTPLANSPLAVGNGSATGAVVESPIVDGNGFIFAVSGTGAAPNTGKAVLVQAKMDLTSARIATVGGSGFFNLHSPAFNDSYFSSATSSTWLIYVAAYDATGANLTYYAPGFDASRNLNIGTPPAANTQNIGTRVGEYAPLTEFKNGANDYLFVGLLIAPSNMGRSNINSFPTATPTVPATGVIANTSTGITGMIVDNASASNQASSIYFCSLGNNAAMKLTQAGFQ